MKKVVLLTLMSAVAAMCLSGWGSVAAVQKKAAPKGKGPDTAGLYQAQCAKCHGADGKGIPSLPDIPNFADAKWQASRTDKHLTDGINDGAGIMPGFKATLKPVEVRALVLYVRAFAKK
jgi:mono/diheme cytochrome c family protein